MIEDFSKIPSIALKPIGFVRNGVKEVPEGRYEDWWIGLVSEIIINPALTDALDGIENEPYIIVLFWMHKIGNRELRLKIHPRDKAELPLKGVLAIRTQYRPNPIGETTVKLLKREGDRLRVEGLDALDGSPVLDIKPYRPDYDARSDTAAHQK